MKFILSTLLLLLTDYSFQVVAAVDAFALRGTQKKNTSNHNRSSPFPPGVRIRLHPEVDIHLYPPRNPGRLPPLPPGVYVDSRIPSGRKILGSINPNNNKKVPARQLAKNTEASPSANTAEKITLTEIRNAKARTKTRPPTIFATYRKAATTADADAAAGPSFVHGADVAGGGAENQPLSSPTCCIS